MVFLRTASLRGKFNWKRFYGPVGSFPGEWGEANISSSAFESVPRELGSLGIFWHRNRMPNVKTLEEAFEFVESVGICTIFSEKAKGVPSLWDAVDLPERSAGRTKWGAKVEAVWAWKNELPEMYPDDIYYGKIPGGHATLMTMQQVTLNIARSNEPGLSSDTWIPFSEVYMDLVGD